MTHLTPWQRLKYAGLMQRKYGNCTVNVWMSPGHYYFNKPIATTELIRVLDTVFKQPYLRDNINDVDIVFLYSFVTALGVGGTSTVAFVRATDMHKNNNILFVNLNVVRKASEKTTKQYLQIYDSGLRGEEFDIAILGKELENTIAHELTHLVQEQLTKAGQIKEQRVKTMGRIYDKLKNLERKNQSLSDLKYDKLEQAINSIFIKAYNRCILADLIIYREGVARFMGAYTSGRYATEYELFIRESQESAEETRQMLSYIKNNLEFINRLIQAGVKAKKPPDRKRISEEIKAVEETPFPIKPYYEIGCAIPAILFRLGNFTIEQIGSMGDHKLINEYTNVCLKNNLEPVYTNKPGARAIINLSDYRSSLHKLRKETLQSIKELKAQQGKWH